MKHKILIILFFIIPFAGIAQLNVNITTNKVPIYAQDGDTISVCRDTLIIFKATADNAGVPVADANWFWSFDDGTQENGIDLDSVAHVFSVGGGYRVNLTVLESGNTGFAVLPVQIDFPVDFLRTNTDIPEEQNGICKGSTVALYGSAVPVIWKDTFINSVIESSPRIVNENTIYESTLSFNEFTPGSVFTDGDIDSLGISLEHSDMGNLQISLTCPDGNSVILKDFDATNNAYLGEPIDDEESSLPGIAYDYFWATAALAGPINSATLNPIPSAAYEPYQAFSNLNGCSLNGDWKIEVIDNAEEDNGFIFSWTIIFNENIIPDTWDFVDTLRQTYTYPDGSMAGTFWNGTNIGGTGIIFSNDTIIGISSAIPPNYGNNSYTYYTVSNWGCPKDTSIFVKVEEVTFTATPPAPQANSDVVFESTTSWAQTYLWTFGDNSDAEAEAAVTHLYEEQGTYNVILIAYDGNGCFDTDTLELEVSIEPSSLAEVPNVFTPNDDGMNDFIKFEVKGMDKFIFTIFNRWGEKVYQTSDQEEITEIGWDGRSSFTNFRLSPGTYYYVVKGTGKDKSEYEEKGTIHLFR